MSDGLVGDAQPTLLPESMCQEDMAYSRKVAVGTCRIDEGRNYSIMLFQVLLSFLGLWLTSETKREKIYRQGVKKSFPQGKLRCMRSTILCGQVDKATPVEVGEEISLPLHNPVWRFECRVTRWHRVEPREPLV